MRHARKRDRNEREIITALVEAGCHVTQLAGPGQPDLLISGPTGTLQLLEVKEVDSGAKAHKRSATGALSELTPAQVKFWSRWEPKPSIVHSVEEALEVCGLG